jgi:hypothetical protein
MVKRGWGKHLKATEALELAKNETEASEKLFAAYK